MGVVPAHRRSHCHTLLRAMKPPADSERSALLFAVNYAEEVHLNWKLRHAFRFSRDVPALLIEPDPSMLAMLDDIQTIITTAPADLVKANDDVRDTAARAAAAKLAAIETKYQDLL